MKKKILMIAEDKFPPFRVDVAVLFAKELRELGYELDWVLQSSSPCSKSYKTQWSNCFVMVGKTNTGENLANRIHKHVLNLINDRAIFRLLTKKQYDIIQVKDKFLSALLAIFASKKNNIKFTFWLSYPFPEASIYEAESGSARYPILYRIRGHFFKILLYKIILPCADHIFVQSEQMKEDIAQMGISKTKMTSVPMGVPLEAIPYSAASSVTEMPKTVLYLGTLIKFRRLDFLIRAFALVKKEIPDAKLILVGAGESPNDEQFIYDEINRCQINDSVNMTGFLPMKDAWEYVRRASVCVSPFFPNFVLNSTSPTKLVEYMAMGKAVVVNDHPEQRIIIRDSGAGTCVNWDELEFANAIINLLKNPQKAQTMGKKGREYIKQHRSYNKIAQHVDSVYQKIIQNND